MAARESLGTTIEPGFVSRVASGLRYAISGVTPTSWFGPSQPLAPAAQEQTEGRQFDYPVGYNLRIQPRSEEAIGFAALRGLADGYDLMRLAIETRKDQLEAFEWELVPADADATEGKYKEQIKAATAMLERPDRESDWPEWLRMMAEDLLVIDTVCVYPRKTKGGKLYSLDLVDGSTIKRLIDEDGRTPMAPSPAYQQVLKGIPAADYTVEELHYLMRNKRTWKLYGYSPVEQVIMTVNIALRRQISQLQFYTEGNIPEAIAQLPKDWPASSVKEFQGWWDSLMEGNTANRRKMKFIPNLEGILFPKAGVIKDEYDEWLARVVCYAFNISPTAFVKQQNRATAEQAADTAKEEGLIPLLRWFEVNLSRLVQGPMGFPELKFKWKMANKVAPKDQAEIDVKYVGLKVLTPDEVRESLGKPPLSAEEKEAAWPTPVDPLINGAEELAPEKDTKGNARPPVPPGKAAPPNAATEKLAKAQYKETAVGRYVKAQQPGLQATVARVLSAQAKQVADKLRSLGKADRATAEMIDALLADVRLDGFGAAVVDNLSPAMRKAFKAAGIRGLLQVDVEATEDIVKQLDVKALRYAETRGAELVKGLDDTTRDDLRSLVTKGVEAGQSTSKLADAIEAMGAFSEARAAVIARTELAYAHVQGNVQGWRESGEEVLKRSILGDLHDHEDECDECADAGVVAMDDDFIPGLKFPPYHPNCICDIAPVLTPLKGDT